MLCKKLKAENFRNIERAEVSFSPGVNLLVGDNAQGKTNLLEAIGYISLGKSFRGATEAEMIAFGHDSASVSLDFSDSLRDQNISVGIFSGKRRRFEQNGVKIYKMSDIVGAIRAVIFCPEHLSLIKSGPGERRAWLDMALCQSRPVYLQSLSRFNKLLKQRNKLLKDAEKDRRTFDATVGIWSEGIAHESALIGKFRYDYVNAASEHIARFFSEMTGGGEIPTVTFSGSAKQEAEAFSDIEATEREYLRLLTSNTDREIAAGSTLYGAHKDDIKIDLNGRSARDFASQGQQRSLALSMKLAEGELCRRDTGEYPVFLLDDVLSELDAKRKSYLVNEIKGKQVIMTGCDLSVKAENTVFVQNGRYSDTGDTGAAWEPS